MRALSCYCAAAAIVEAGNEGAIRVNMPANLSFGKPIPTDRFYPPIPQTMAARARADALPPSAAEFAEWVSSRCGADASHSSVLDCGCGVHAFNIRACARLGFRRVEAIDVNPDVAVGLRDQAGRIGFTAGSGFEPPFRARRVGPGGCAGVGPS